MFIEQKKKRQYKTFIYAAIIIVLCLIIIVIAWPRSPEIQPEDSRKQVQDNSAATQDETEKEVYNPGHIVEKIQDNQDDKKEEVSDENKDISVENPTYYLVRRDSGGIKVYFVDASGIEIELETTDIVYDVLGPEDQKLFDEGYRVETQEELAVLLQDFES